MEGQPWRKGVFPGSDFLRPQPRAGPTVKLVTFLGKREQASVVFIEGGHCPGVPWTFFEISGLLLHLKNKNIAQWQTTNEEKTIVRPKNLRFIRNYKSRQNRQKDRQPYLLEHIILKASTAEKNTNYFKQSKKWPKQQKLFLERANWRKKRKNEC